MTDLSHQNQSFYLCTIFIRKLYDLGLRNVVISPGSRSTPLTLAAAAHPGLQKHVILDERSAAFTALGIGKSSGFPALLICTSGTATANYYPAVIEAYQSGVPLLVATADRPSHLTNTDANQTIDQSGLFGKYARSYTIDVAGSKGFNDMLDQARQDLHQLGNLSGPVHLNFPFSKPLEPTLSFINKLRQENQQKVDKQRKHSASSPNENDHFCFPEHVESKLNQAKKPVIIIGQLPPNVDYSSIIELAKKLKSPVLSEHGFFSSTLSIQGFDGFLRTESIQKQLEPDLILRFGLQPASKSLLIALENWQAEHHIYIANTQNQKKSALPVTDTLTWNGKAIDFEIPTSPDDSWPKKWDKASKEFNRSKKSLVAETNRLTDGHIYEELSVQIPENWSIFFSNSFSARDRSMFGYWNTQNIFTNRGASGIDGITSTAIGVGIGSNSAQILFTGDLAFLHDINALLNRKTLKKPLVIVVLNNNGGSIFRMLPISAYQDFFTQYFETPQSVEISNLCEGYDTAYQRIETLDELEAFNLGDFVEKSDSNLLVLECKTDPGASMQLRKKLWDLD